METLARGYLKFEKENPQLAEIMLLGFIRTLRHIFEQSAVLIIIDSGRGMEIYEQYLLSLPNAEGRQASKNPNRSVASLYGFRPLERLLGDNRNPILAGNPKKDVPLNNTRILMSNFN